MAQLAVTKPRMAKVPAECTNEVGPTDPILIKLWLETLEAVVSEAVPSKPADITEPEADPSRKCHICIKQNRFK